MELEYVQGCTLLSQIRLHNKLIAGNMPFYGAEILETLQFLHGRNIVYRDLKPENIILSMVDRGHIKIVDFGFARHLKSGSQRCYTNCGTPQYVAPEILMGIGHSFEADIWSFGVLLYEIECGQTPFVAENILQIFEKINSCQINYNYKIKVLVRELLDQIFVADPE